MTEVTAVEVIASTSNRRPSNGETLISLVLDETGSMMSCYDSTITSVNDYIGSQKNAPSVAKASLYTFSSNGLYGGAHMRAFGVNMQAAMQDARDTGKEIRPVFENVAIAEVGFLDKNNYRPNGGTNLYDAIGTTIRRVEAQLAPLAEIPNVLVVIVTDGGENASHEYNLAAIKNMIKEKEAEGWTFIYLGANQDAFSVGSSFGLSKGQTMTYSTDSMDSTMATLASATTTYRSARSVKGFAADGQVERNFFNGDK